MLHLIKKPVSVSATTYKSSSVIVKSSIALLVFTIVLALSSWSNRHYLMGGSAAYKLAVTYHQLTLNGKILNYKANTGYLPVNDKNNKPAANIFYTAYTAGGKTDNNRPITFVFNGGPGSAAIWLHMGSFGPVRVLFKNDKGDAPEKQYQYGDNPESWLGFTDLVFIDPVSTGYSRPQDGVDAKQFYGYKADVASIGEFIRLYLEQQHREASPKFLIGESYGAVRAIGLAEYLQDNYRIALNGITLISPALNYGLLNFSKGNQQPYSYYLPTYAVSAQYYHRLAPGLQQLSPHALTARVNAFAQGTYTRFLNDSNASAALTNSVIDSVSYYTGLPKAYLLTVNARVTDKQFTAHLLKANSLAIGNYDSRFTGNSKLTTDPSETNLRGLFIKAFNNYIDTDLQYQNTLPYNATVAVGNWDYGTDKTNKYLNASATLKKIMIANPQLKINVVGGYYDLATPIATTAKVIDELDLPVDLSNNISINYYQSGHMVYISKAANAKFKIDGERFYAEAL